VATVPSEQLEATALCTDEDVRVYLGIKTDDLSEDDRNTIIRLVNAASETYTTESQRIWKLDPELPTIRLYRLDSFDIQVGRLRIDDAAAITAVGVGDYRSPLGPQPLASDGGAWYGWQEEPGWPITAIVFVEGLTIQPGNVVSVDAEWGWPKVPQSVRQDVIVTASEWYARDVEKFSSTFSLDQGRVILPQTLPNQVRRNAENWRRWRVA
jgi:hypothetical protein